MPDIEQARQTLHGHLLDCPWYVASTWGRHNDERVLLVYVEDSPPANALPKEWHGWPVVTYRSCQR